MKKSEQLQFAYLTGHSLLAKPTSLCCEFVRESVAHNVATTYHDFFGQLPTVYGVGKLDGSKRFCVAPKLPHTAVLQSAVDQLVLSTPVEWQHDPINQSMLLFALWERRGGIDRASQVPLLFSHRHRVLASVCRLVARNWPCHVHRLAKPWSCLQLAPEFATVLQSDFGFARYYLELPR